METRNKLTLVTAYFDLKRRENNSNKQNDSLHYIKHAEKLMKLPLNFVIFVDEDYVETYKNLQERPHGSDNNYCSKFRRS